jgi:seryl-tRNA synthetase
MSTLYEIADNYKELLNMDLDEETLADTLESIQGEFNDKADNICHVVANIKSDVEAIEAEMSRLKARKDGFELRLSGLKDYLRLQMESIECKKIETSKFTINCVVGRQVVNVTDESKIPDAFFDVKRVVSLDKKMLLENLKAQIADSTLVTIEGAEIAISKSSLRIK